MTSIIVLFLLIAILMILAMFIYKVVYTYKINKRILAGEVNGKKLVDVSKMIMVATIVGLAAFSGLLIYIVNDYKNQDNTVPRNNFAIIDISDTDNYKYAHYMSYMGHEGLKDASFAKVYSKEGNEGYSKEVIESGEYIFTVFTRTAPADMFHPDFLCFVEFAGENKDNYVLYNSAGFESIEEKTDEDGFQTESGGDISDTLLYIGYLEKDCKFNINMNLMDEEAEMEYNEAMQKAYDEDKGEFPVTKDYATSTGSVSIVVD